jgi:hypothetical protein
MLKVTYLIMHIEHYFTRLSTNETIALPLLTFSLPKDNSLQSVDPFFKNEKIIDLSERQ